MNRLNIVLFFIFVTVLSCDSVNETTTEKKGKEPSVFDVTNKTLKAIDDLDENVKYSEKLQNLKDSLLKAKNNTIKPIPFDSHSLDDVDTILVTMDLNSNFVIQDKYINRTVISYTSKLEEKRSRYLGLIKIGEHFYHVVTEFYIVQLANSKKGNSFLYFFTNKKELTKFYDLEMPNNLPTSILDSHLIFKVKGIEKSLTLEKEFPIILCLPEDLGCFE